MGDLILVLAVAAFMALGLPLAGRVDAFFERTSLWAEQEAREAPIPPLFDRKKAG